MEGQAATTEATSSEAATSAADSGGTDAAATTAEAAKETAAAPAESKGEGDSLLSTGDVEADKAPEAPEKAEAPEAAPDGQEAAKEEKKLEDAAKEGEEEAESADEKAGEPVIDGLPENFHWRDLLVEDKNKKRANDFSSLDDVMAIVREHDNLKRRAVLPPNQKSTDEELSTFRKRMGVPDTPDGYQVEMGDDADAADEALVERLKMAAHGVHMTPGQLGSLLQWYDQEQKNAEEFEREARQQHVAQVKTALSTKWLGDLPKNLGIANKTFKEAFGEYVADVNEMKLEDGTHLVDSPIFALGMYKLGRKFTEAGIPGESAWGDRQPTSDELKSMMSDPRYGLHDPSKRDMDFYNKVQQGFERLSGKR